MPFPYEHPSYILRRIESQNEQLRKVAKDLDSIDVTDPEALRETLKKIAKGVADISLATGSLTRWVHTHVR